MCIFLYPIDKKKKIKNETENFYFFGLFVCSLLTCNYLIPTHKLSMGCSLHHFPTADAHRDEPLRFGSDAGHVGNGQHSRVHQSSPDGDGNFRMNEVRHLDERKCPTTWLYRRPTSFSTLLQLEIS
jgi:hypothetical protein